MIHSDLYSLLLRLLSGGLLGLGSACLAGHFGWRAAERMPGESRWPHCLFCLERLNLDEMIPILGWILRKRAFLFPCPCGARRRQGTQPLIEFLGFALGAGVAALAPWSASLVPLAIGLGLLPAIALIDIHFGVIPDGLNMLVAVCGFLWLAMGGGNLAFGLVTAGLLLGLGLFLALIYSRWRGREMLGLGDVKFFAAAGLWLQMQTAPWFLAVAGITGVATAYLWKRAGGGKELPFGPALCLALAACIFYRICMA